jgi:hypothetical protein
VQVVSSHCASFFSAFCPCALSLSPVMSIASTLSVDCVKMLIDGNVSADSSVVFIVQVIDISWLKSSNGHDRCAITISDGDHFTECFVAPQLFGVVRNAVDKYSVVQVSNITCSIINGHSLVIVNDLVVVSDADDVLNEPVPFEKVVSEPLSDASNVRSISATGTRRKFQAQHNERLSATSEEEVLVTRDFYVSCENCNCKPCDWTQFGPGIIAHLNDEYIGCYIDADGNIVEGNHDGGSVITNKQLRFLAYSAYTSAKHGYLGKRKRIPIPHCVESGIRRNFPEENGFYIGFKNADDA